MAVLPRRMHELTVAGKAVSVKIDAVEMIGIGAAHHHSGQYISQSATPYR